MHEIDRGVGLEQVAPHAFAGMRLARDEQHAEAVAHAVDHHGSAVVLQRLLGRACGRFELDDVLAAMSDGHADGRVLADGCWPIAARLTVDAHRDLRIAAGRAAEIIDAEGDLRFAADDVVAGRANDGELAVPFAGGAGHEHMERRTEMERARIGRIVDFAVGDDDRARDAIGRRVGQGRVQRGEQRGAAGLRARIRAGEHFGFANLDVQGFELLAIGGNRLVGVGAARADLHALGAVDDKGDNVRQPLAGLMQDQRIGERQKHDHEGDHARPGAMGAPVDGEGEDDQGERGERRHQPKRDMRCERDAEGEKIHRFRSYLPRRSSRAGTWTWSVL